MILPPPPSPFTSLKYFWFPADKIPPILPKHSEKKIHVFRAWRNPKLQAEFLHFAKTEAEACDFCKRHNR